MKSLSEIEIELSEIGTELREERQFLAETLAELSAIDRHLTPYWEMTEKIRQDVVHTYPHEPGILGDDCVSRYARDNADKRRPLFAWLDFLSFKFGPSLKQRICLDARRKETQRAIERLEARLEKGTQRVQKMKSRGAARR